MVIRPMTVCIFRRKLLQLWLNGKVRELCLDSVRWTTAETKFKQLSRKFIAKAFDPSIHKSSDKLLITKLEWIEFKRTANSDHIAKILIRIVEKLYQTPFCAVSLFKSQHNHQNEWRNLQIVSEECKFVGKMIHAYVLATRMGTNLFKSGSLKRFQQLK